MSIAIQRNLIGHAVAALALMMLSPWSMTAQRNKSDAILDLVIQVMDTTESGAVHPNIFDPDTVIRVPLARFSAMGDSLIAPPGMSQMPVTLNYSRTLAVFGTINKPVPTAMWHWNPCEWNDGLSITYPDLNQSGDEELVFTKDTDTAALAHYEMEIWIAPCVQGEGVLTLDMRRAARLQLSFRENYFDYNSTNILFQPRRHYRISGSDDPLQTMLSKVSAVHVPLLADQEFIIEVPFE